MTGPRIAIIVLIVIAALFAASVVIGVNRRGKEPPPDKQSARHYSPPSWLGNIGGMLGRFGPRLKAEEINPGKGVVITGNTFTVEQSPVEMLVKPSEEHYRKATFVVKAGQGFKIKYETDDPDAGDLKVQEWPAGDDDRQKGSIIVLKSGGKLTMSCEQKPCTAELQ